MSLKLRLRVVLTALSTMSARGRFAFLKAHGVHATVLAGVVNVEIS